MSNSFFGILIILLVFSTFIGIYLSIALYAKKDLEKQELADAQKTKEKNSDNKKI